MQPTSSSKVNPSATNKPGAPAETELWSLEDHWQELIAALADHFTESVSALQSQIDQ